MDTSGGSASNLNCDELEIKTFPSCSIYTLKHLISKMTQLKLADQILAYQGVTLENHFNL